MTTASPLHVELPSSSSKFKSFSDSPPTPYTPMSAVSMHQGSDSASVASAKAPRSPASPHPPHNVASEVETNGAENGHAETSRTAAVFAEGREVEGKTQEIELSEMGVAPPDTLPPSPPLTEIEGRDDDGPPARLRDSRGDASHLPEEDITNWQSSVDGRDGSYHEDDLGYSTGNEVTPIDGRGLGGFGGSTRPGGVSQDRLSMSSTRQELQHPLRLDVHPPSPPLWEVIQPPENNNGRPTVGALSPGKVAREDRTTKAATTRPLIPYSSYYFGPPPIDAAYGTDPVGQIGFHQPREIIRIERDYSGGELVQFAPIYPLELEGRITPTQFLETINVINEVLISAHSLRHSFIDNALGFFTLQLSRLVTTTHYKKEMGRLQTLIEEMNRSLYNPLGLNILWPRKVAFMFLEIEYY